VQPGAQAAAAAAKGFTLVELMVVIAVVLMLVSLATPSVRELLAVQRLQNVHAALVTDLQFARSEAVRRRQPLIFEVSGDANSSCYVLFADAFGAGGCDCNRGPGQACWGSHTEIRAVQTPRSTSVSYVASSSVANRTVFEMETGYSQRPGDFRVDLVSSPRGSLRVNLNATGRLASCSPDGSMKQVPLCP
jgi:type IV fimbrial biogenesis protein FimT